MRNVLEQLRALRTPQFAWPTRTPEIEARMDWQRESWRAPFLAHFGRMALRGKKGLAIAHNGVGSEWRLRIPSGTQAALASDHALNLRDNCGRHRDLPEDESPGRADGPAAPPAPTITHQRKLRLSKFHVL